MDLYEKFLQDLKKTLDIDLSGYKRPQMERRINTLMRILKVENYQEFVQVMKKDKGKFERFLNHLTINVSEFFRNNTQWDVLQNKILPELLSKTQNLRIWSAGCSTGEEPYTLAMILAERFSAGNHTIFATDFDDRVLNKAKEGYYLNKDLMGTPKIYLQKYFDMDERGGRVKNSLKNMITFQHHNLLKDKFPEKNDLIICRNVVIYFTEETKSMLYKKFSASLRNGGVLFTGSTEQIFNSSNYNLSSVAIFFYKKT